MNPATKKEELINLCQAASPDDNREEVQYFCDQLLNSDDDVQTIYEQNKCVAAVGVVRTKFSYNGIEIPSAIGSYLCVDSAYRNKGYSVAVGISCARYCSGQGVDLLIGWEVSPKLRHLYELGGSFLYRDYVKRTTICRADIPVCEINDYRVETTQRNIVNEYNDFVRENYRNYMIHSEKAWAMMGREADFFLVYDRAGVLRGIAIRLFCAGDHYIEEFIAVDEHVKNCLLNHIASHYQWNRFTYSEYGVGVTGAEISHGMIRILNAENMLKRYAELHPDYKDAFTVRDEMIPENSKSYQISQGKCEVVAIEEPFREISVLQLSELLFDGLYLNLCIAY